jgi:hypothetical protein
MTERYPMLPPAADSTDSTIRLRPPGDRPANRAPARAPRLFEGLLPRGMVAVPSVELQTMRARASAYVNLGPELKALLQMADVTDGLSAQADDDHIRLSFAASRLGAMIRQFVQSYRLRSFSVAVIAADKLDEFVDAREREYLRQGVEAARILAEELGHLADRLERPS